MPRMVSRGVVVFCSENLPPNAFLDTLSQDSVLWWVPCQSACKVNPISEQHMGRGSLPPPPEVWPLLCLLALTQRALTEVFSILCYQ